MVRFFRFIIKESVRAIAIPLMLFAALAVAVAFTEPTSAPTGGTVYAPVNTSAVAQTKSGNFTSSGTVTGNIVNGTSQMCLAGSCISAWPAGGGGGYWAANGTAIYNTNAGNVGIGTTNPGAKLDIASAVNGLPATSGTADNNVDFRVRSNTNLLLDFGSSNSPVVNWIQSRDTTTYAANYALALNPNGGNVGIGTAFPSQKLDVAGNVNVTGCFMVNGTCISSGGGGITSVNAMTGPAISVVAGSGIGISNSANTVTITNTGGSGGSWAASGSDIYNTNAGSVGIGTASPSEKLHIAGNIYIANNWYKAGNLTSVNNAISTWGAEGGVLAGFNSGRAVGMGQTTNGYAGMGVSSGGTPLSAFYYDPFSNESVVEGYIGAGVRFSTGGQNRMSIKSYGNVGIGTASPSEKLEVNGNIKAGRLYMGDQMYGSLSGRIGIGTDGSAVGVQGAYLNVGNTWGTAYANVYAQDYWINSLGRWASSFSDIRLKKDIQPVGQTLEKLEKINGVSFLWNDLYPRPKGTAVSTQRNIGVVAQEVERTFPELVRSGGEYKTVDYNGLTAVLLEAVKEQQKEIESLKARIDALERK